MKDEGYMKKYMKIRTLPIHGPWDLKKIQAHPLICGLGGGRGGSQSPGLGVPQRKDMEHVNIGMNLVNNDINRAAKCE